jgi:putative hydrolase of the HAD superfamily
MHYSALCLDLDDTLWPVAPAILQAERATAGWVAESHPDVAGAALPETLIAIMRRWREEVAVLHPERAFDLTWLRTEALRRQALAAGRSEPEAVAFAAAAFEVFFAWRHAVQPYPDVPVALSRLSRRFPLFVLSNGNAEPARTPLGRHFREAFSARSLGIAKPDPRAFLAVAARVGIPAERWLYVGDDPHADVAGARGAGMATAWIHRREKQWPAGLARADHEFVDLTGLADHLLEPDAN